MEKTAEVIESIEQCTSVWKVIVSEHQGADIKDRTGLSISWADSKFPFWNAVFLTEQLTDEGLLSSRVEEASTYVRGKRQMGLIYICQDYLSGSAKESLSTVLEREKLELALPVTGVAGEILPLQKSLHSSSSDVAAGME